MIDMVITVIKSFPQFASGRPEGIVTDEPVVEPPGPTAEMRLTVRARVERRQRIVIGEVMLHLLLMVMMPCHWVVTTDDIVGITIAVTVTIVRNHRTYGPIQSGSTIVIIAGPVHQTDRRRRRRRGRLRGRRSDGVVTSVVHHLQVGRIRDR